MSHNSRRWTPATVWILQKMVWIIEIFGQSPRFSLAETKISPALRFMEMAFWAVFAGISHSAGVQRSDLWVKLNLCSRVFRVDFLNRIYQAPEVDRATRRKSFRPATRSGTQRQK